MGKRLNKSVTLFNGVVITDDTRFGLWTTLPARLGYVLQQNNTYMYTQYIYKRTTFKMPLKSISLHVNENGLFQ